MYLHQKIIRIYADIVQNHTLPGVFPNFWRAVYIHTHTHTHTHIYSDHYLDSRAAKLYMYMSMNTVYIGLHALHCCGHALRVLSVLQSFCIDRSNSKCTICHSEATSALLDLNISTLLIFLCICAFIVRLLYFRATEILGYQPLRTASVQYFLQQ